MAKKESSLKNMVITLFVICVVSSALLGYAYTVTLKPKADAALAKQLLSIKKVLPTFDNNPFEEMYQVESIDGGEKLECYPAKKQGQLVGVAVKTWSTRGYGGLIRLMVGFDAKGNVYDISVLEQKETPGLGVKMLTPEFRRQYKGKNPGSDDIKVKKDGGEMDAITAATISSRAFSDAVQRAYNSYTKINKQ